MALGEVRDFYGPEDQFSNLSRMQSGQALGYGAEAARLADPYSPYRKTAQDLSVNALKDPGGALESQPWFKFQSTYGMDNLQRQLARQGKLNSGNALADISKFQTGLASQSYFPYMDMLALYSGAKTGSPGYAGAAYQKAGDRSQDYAQMAAAQKAYGQGNRGGGGYSGFGGKSPLQQELDNVNALRGPSTFGTERYGSGGYGGYSGYGSDYGGNTDYGSQYSGYDYGLPSGGGADYGTGQSDIDWSAMYASGDPYQWDQYGMDTWDNNNIGDLYDTMYYGGLE